MAKIHLTEGTGTISICGSSSNAADLRPIDKFIHVPPADRCSRCTHLRSVEFNAAVLTYAEGEPARHLAATVRFCRELLESDNRTLTRFQERFSDNPMSALRSADEAFDAAANAAIAGEVLAFLTGEVNPDFEGDRLACIRDEFTRDVMSAALHQRWSSSSVSSNKMEEALRIAKARFLDRLKRWVR